MLLDGGAATLPRLGYRYDLRYLGMQIGALALTSVALAVLRPGPGGRRPRIGGRGALAAAILICAAVVVQVLGPPSRLDAAKVMPTYCGSVEGVPVCLYPEHRRVAEAFDERLWALFDAATTHGYGALVPARVVEASRTAWPAADGVGVIAVLDDGLAGRSPTVWEVASTLVEPLQCSGVQGDRPPSDQYWRDLTALTATWAGLVDPAIAQENGYTDEPLAPDAAATLLRQFQTCTYAFE